MVLPSSRGMELREVVGTWLVSLVISHLPWLPYETLTHCFMSHWVASTCAEPWRREAVAAWPFALVLGKRVLLRNE